MTEDPECRQRNVAAVRSQKSEQNSNANSMMVLENRALRKAQLSASAQENEVQAQILESSACSDTKGAHPSWLHLGSGRSGCLGR